MEKDTTKREMSAQKYETRGAVNQREFLAAADLPVDLPMVEHRAQGNDIFKEAHRVADGHRDVDSFRDSYKPKPFVRELINTTVYVGGFMVLFTLAGLPPTWFVFCVSVVSAIILNQIWKLPRLISGLLNRRHD
ncbi:MAG: hypothetical protein RLZZ283_639 [Candidatus Parcubacteria bacterium]|jgi:hypothetical protein